MFRGAFTALITPFKDKGIDEESLRKLVDFQVEAGINGLVPCGTTGESATLTHEEHKKVIAVTIDAAGGRVPIIAGTGSNSTEETIELTAHAKKAGADAALLITPYYNKPTQEGLYRHYKAVAEAVDIPIILYNVPSRTALNMLPETVARLSKVPNIAGIKEATADMEQSSWLRRLCGMGFNLLSGDDATTLPFLSIGGQGVISVISNLVPAQMTELCRAFSSGEMEKARKIHEELLPLAKVMFCETNPIPVKEAMHLMAMSSPDIRLPLTRLSEENRKQLASVMKDLKLIP